MHIDIPAQDRETTANFYRTLCGWNIGATDEATVYTSFQAGNLSGGFPNLRGGLRAVTEVFQAGDIVLYLPSEDIEADLRQVEALGGTVLLPRTEVAPGAWVALFADPNGARLALASQRPEVAA
jgi:hypothetical protein